jgi:hypothetical protein
VFAVSVQQQRLHAATCGRGLVLWNECYDSERLGLWLCEVAWGLDANAGERHQMNRENRIAHDRVLPLELDTSRPEVDNYLFTSRFAAANCRRRQRHNSIALGCSLASSKPQDCSAAVLKLSFHVGLLKIRCVIVHQRTHAVDRV